MAVGVPDVADDLTLDWFQNALNESEALAVELASIKVEPLDPSKGLIGDLYRVHLSYNQGDGPQSVIVKLPAASPSSRQIGTMLNAYEREALFYQHVAPQARGANFATCFYTDIDNEAGRWVIVLEDCPADAFDVFMGATQSQAQAAVDALADFHATWWRSDRRFEWMPGFDSTGVGRLQPLWLENLPSFLDRYAHVVPEPAAAAVMKFAPHLADWSAKAAKEPLTMVHSDYRLDNLIFAGDRVTIIDWQTAMRAPAAMDLSCFISTSLSIENRRTHEAPLIDRYLERIRSHGVTVDRDWFLRSYDENLLWWMGQFGNNLAHLDPNSDVVQAALDSMIERVYTAALDRNVGRLLS